MLLQWRDELESRFGLSFVIFDRDYVARIRRERGYSANPWRSHSHFLISHALIRDESYKELLLDWLDHFAPGSLLIVDEAHNAAPSSGVRYAIDSMLTRAVRELAPRFEHRLFLSATPHNGHPNSFAALLELLDPQRFLRGTPIGNSKVLSPVMVRRLKSDLREAGIVEFARQRQDDGGDEPEEAATKAARTRLRPILMTSFAFILGVIPLAVATGAGSEMRQSLGTAVLFGMFGVTAFGLLFTPAFYTFIRKLGSKRRT
jgi:superfamily II DNA or RNA helicase